jgi:5-formyltetrahydrofolate cyclo-ligase
VTSPVSPEDSVARAKRELRREIVAQRDAVTPALREDWSAKIHARLQSVASFRQAAVILAYCSMGSEFLTDEFIRAVQDQGKRLVLPKVDRTTRALRLYHVESPKSQLVAGVWGIQEPDPARCESVLPEDIQWVLVPGVAFDAQCRRLGYGGGYYDKLLEQVPIDSPRVAAAFSLQIVAHVPVTARDQLVHRIVTETEEFIQAP